MDELIPKILEYGALAAINLLLIVKGVKAMQDLTAAIDKLANKVDKISERQTALENEFRLIARQFEKLETRFENNFRDLRDVIERRFPNAKANDS